MPCSDGSYDNRQEILTQNREYKEKLDIVTNMLCEMCSKVKFNDLPQNIRGWYSRHLDNDRKRVKKLFDEFAESFNSKVVDMTGEELREIEKVLILLNNK